jgi:hypothetical protein
MSNDVRVLRKRQATARDALDSSLGGGEPYGSAAEVVQTTTVSTYPTVAGAFYACLTCDIDGAEVEGGTATYVTRAGASPIYCFNLGTSIPPVGSTLVVHGVGNGRWTFRYDG